MSTPSLLSTALVQLQADWNQDGMTDLGLSWAEPYEGGWCWYVGMQVAGGGSSAVPLGDLGDAFAKVFAVIDADPCWPCDPPRHDPELFAIVDTVEGGWLVGIFGLGDDGRIVRLHLADGTPFDLPVYVTAADRSGLYFDHGMGHTWMAWLQAESDDGFATWTPHVALLEIAAPFTVTIRDFGDSWNGALEQFGQIADGDCVYLDAVVGTPRP